MEEWRNRDAHLPAYKLQPSIHDLYSFAALLFLENRTDEFVDVWRWREGGEFLNAGLIPSPYGDEIVWGWEVRVEKGRGGRRGVKVGKMNLLDGFIFLLLRFELLAGGDGGLEVCGFIRCWVYLVGMGGWEGKGKRERGKGNEREVPVCSFWYSSESDWSFFSDSAMVDFGQA